MDRRAPLARDGWSLRWQLVAAQMAVVVVGVVTLALSLEWVLRRLDPRTLERALATLPGVGSDTFSPTSVSALLDLVRLTAWRALAVAAGAATLIGLATSVLLTRALLHPLEALTRSSRRIARGRYSERVARPATVELGAVADSFNQMARSLDEIEQQRAALIGNVMHELRTPLTALGGYLEALMDGVLEPDPATLIEMDQEVRRLVRLVDDLQELSRVEAGQISLRPGRVPLEPLIERVVAQLRPQATARALRLEIESVAAPLQVIADPDRTTQVLLNLIGNAIRYTPEGGQITVRSHRDASVARIEVEDTGIGIPPEALPYLFERFYRVDRSRARRTGGSGIGLTISRHLAWAMGGDLHATSQGRDRGSTFTFTLPLAGEGDG